MKDLRCLAMTSALLLGAAVAVQPIQAQYLQKEKQEPKKQPTEQTQQTDRRPPDEVLETRATIRLARSATLAGTDIKVDAQDGNLTLTGHVLSEIQQDRAKQLAGGISGVKDVKVALTVDPDYRLQATEEKAVGADTSAGVADEKAMDADTAAGADEPAAGAHATLSDDQLAQQVAQRVAMVFTGAKADKEWMFGWDVEGEKWQFDVEVDEGDVILDGSVPSFMEIGKAVEAARKVPGVRSVDASDLRVDEDFLANDPHRDWIERQYEEIKADVKSAVDDVKKSTEREKTEKTEKTEAPPKR